MSRANRIFFIELGASIRLLIIIGGGRALEYIYRSDYLYGAQSPFQKK